MNHKYQSEAQGEVAESAHIVCTKVANGMFWVAVPEAKVYILCGCPADSVKHLVKANIIKPIKVDGVDAETGPNCILLSDNLLQKGEFANLSEFPVLQMLYSQGLLVPGHPNNTGSKPLLLGSSLQVAAQKEYIFRGNYGLSSEQELFDAGEDTARVAQQMEIKTRFHFGRIKPTEELLDSINVEDKSVEIKNGVTIKRRQFNVFDISYGTESVRVDLNLGPNENYQAPYELPMKSVLRNYFSVVHSGEGDGWDATRPCMSSILIFKGKVYLIDAGPNVGAALHALGIDPTEIEGIFHTHSHDDHFAGLPTLLRGGQKIKYFTVKTVRAAVTKKLSALMSIEESRFAEYFDVCDLPLNQWFDIEGLQVKAIDSPHPVETVAFSFKAKDAGVEKTFTHLADITRIDVLKGLAEQGQIEGTIPQDYVDTIHKGYLEPADIKKLDIGGGMIHGDIADFTDDQSSIKVLAHTALPLNDEQLLVGGRVPFGTVHTLLDDGIDYLRVRAAEFLRLHFGLEAEQQVALWRSGRIELLPPGTTLMSPNQHLAQEMMLLTGQVMCLLPDQGDTAVPNGVILEQQRLRQRLSVAAEIKTTSYTYVLFKP